MEFRILGPLEAREDGVVLALGGARQRALLAVLLLRANEVVSIEGLIDALWEDPPARATKAVQVYVSRLRKALGGSVPTSRPRGYVLELEPEQFDLARFQQLLEEARRDPPGAADKLKEALSLWRGPALAEFASEPFARVERLRLEELRLEALEERIDAELALGRHASVAGELETLVASEPLRERLRGQLMLALYRCGRQAEALAAFRQGRSKLVEELGIEPGRRLRELEQAILRQDPALESSASRTAAPAPARAPAHGDAVALQATAEERKVVTVLFADLAHITARAETMDPEDVRALFAPYHARLREELERFGGTVERFAGDALIGVFGAPVTHEDDPERAVRAALAIRDWATSESVGLRIGVSTGVALVAIGSRPHAGGGRVAGDVVNTAARLESAAVLNGILVGASTYRATREAFEYRDAAAAEATGKVEPAWEPLAARSAVRAARPYTTPLVGRSRELALLETHSRTLWATVRRSSSRSLACPASASRGSSTSCCRSLRWRRSSSPGARATPFPTARASASGRWVKS
jgi:DNA-binding SARP family transcriptional activator